MPVNPEYVRAWAMVALPAALVGAAAALMHRPHDAPSADPVAAEGRTETPDERLERLVAEKVVSDAPGDFQAWSNPSFQFYHGLSDDELRELRRDPGRVVDELLGFVSGPGRTARRRKVLRALQVYLDELEGPVQARRFVHLGTELIASGALPVELETDLAWDVALRSRAIGMEPSDREALRRRARVVLSSPLPHPDYAKVWALSLARLGGSEEREIVLGAWDRLDWGGRSMLLDTGFVGSRVP